LPDDAIDIKMGTLSKTIPSVGGYIAANARTVEFLKHEARGFFFSAVLPPPCAAAAKAALEVIEDEPERVEALRRNVCYFRGGLQRAGVNIPHLGTAVFPIMCGTTEVAARMQKYCFDNGVFVDAIFPPAVPEGTARLRVTVTAGHNPEDLDYGAAVIGAGIRELMPTESLAPARKFAVGSMGTGDASGVPL
jgi:7-keto-8-aminopelargonate synthetase-like enzyme